MKRICVYCGSTNKVASHYLDAAYTMGQLIAQRGLELYFGAGAVGMMGRVADGALAAGGIVVGVVPELFNSPTVIHQRATRMEVVDTMHTRKARLAELADGFIALPGGIGTFEELFEILTWAQIGLHAKPIGLHNVNGYYDPLVALIKHAKNEGFVYGDQADQLHVESDAGTLLDAMMAYEMPEQTKKSQHSDE